MAPKNVISAWIESSENITTFQNDSKPKIIKAYSPRFVHGEGSISKIFLELDQNDTNDIKDRNYSIYSTFDEGSSVVLYPPSPYEAYGLLDFLYHNLPLEWYKFYVGGGFRNLIFWIVIFGIFLGLLVYFVNHLIFRRKQSSFVNKIHKQIRIIGRKLKEDEEYLGSFRSESDPLIRTRTTDLESSKYSLNSHTYGHTSRWNWVLFWTYSRHSIWDLWYAKSDDFKSQAFPSAKSDDIYMFYSLLTERELPVDFKKYITRRRSQIQQVLNQLQLVLEKVKIKRVDEKAYWPIPIGEVKEVKDRIQLYACIKKLNEILKPYLGGVGDIKSEKIFRLLANGQSTSTRSEEKNGAPILTHKAEETPGGKDSELKLKSFAEKIVRISEDEINKIIKAKNLDLLKYLLK